MQETRTISHQIELIKNYRSNDFDYREVCGELLDISLDIEYCLDHIENMLLPYADRVPTIEEIKNNIKEIYNML